MLTIVSEHNIIIINQIWSISCGVNEKSVKKNHKFNTFPNIESVSTKNDLSI